jgi:type II secretory pathway pseudopilin PulG
MKALNSSRRKRWGFSLVEVTIAIGLFAFVIVGIIGLFPAALKQRADAGFETRSVMIARQIYQGIEAGESLTAALMPDVDIKWEGNPTNSTLTLKNINDGVVLGFSKQGTTVNHIFSNKGSWASQDVGPPQQEITTKALVEATAAAGSGNVYEVTVSVGFPANLPAARRRIETFRKLVYSP